MEKSDKDINNSDIDGKNILENEYKGEDSAKQTAANASLSIMSLLYGMSQATIDNSTAITIVKDTYEKDQMKRASMEENINLIMQKLGMKGGEQNDQGEPMASVQPKEPMQPQQPSSEEAIQSIAQSLANQNNR